MTRLAYLDASALTKLVVEEAESVALNRWYIEAQRLVTSRIGVVETMRASSRRPCDPLHRDRIMSGSVHESEAFFLYSLSVAVDFDEGGGSPFCESAQGLLINSR